MNGLTGIINGILQDADEEIKKIKENAEARAEQIIADATASANAAAEEEERTLGAKAEFIRKRYSDSAESKGRTLILSAKQDTIEKMLGTAYTSLMTVSGEKYEDILLSLLKKNLHPGKCTLFFPKADVFSDGFMKKVEDIAKNSDCTLSVSTENESVKKGFIAVYENKDGSVEENCSFDVLFKSNYALLRDKAAEILFA